MADFDQAIRLWPNNATFLITRGNAYANKFEYDRAIADYDQTLGIRPNDAEAFYKRGLAKQKKGDAAGGNADMAKAKTLGFKE
jgi:tetratricopeptide (TPR) repeat protein